MAASLLALWLTTLLSGCRLHVAGVRLNRPLSVEKYHAIELGSHGRGDLLRALGPPDRVRYTPTELILDYEAASHRATDLRFFVPTFPLPIDPPPIFQLPRFFFDLFQESEEFRPTGPERAGQAVARAAASRVPFTRGEDLLILRGRQLRRDRLRVVLDRETLSTRRKALRLSTGEYAQESLVDQVLLRTD